MRISLSSLSLPLVAVLLLTTLSSCGDIHQDLKLNADGSGTLETSFDIGEIMNMTKGFGEMGVKDVTISAEEEQKDINLSEPEAPEAPEAPKDSMQMLMDKITNPEYDRDIDTLISFMSIMPDSVKEKEERMDLVNKIHLRLKSPAKSTSLIMGIVMNFDNAAQLKELVEYMERMDRDPTAGMMANAGPGGLQKETFLMFEADMKAGWIRFDSVSFSGISAEMGMPADSIMGSEDMGMMEMMFGNSKIKSIIHVPGEVTSCTNENAILTKDNRVILEYSFMDVLKGGKVPGYTIYFEPKK